MHPAIERFILTIFGVINSIFLALGYRLVKVNHLLKNKGRFMHDYVRYSTLYLISHQINELMLSGDVAELGVYRGNFAQHINQLFPNKTIYLFDTYTGFDKNDINIDKENKYSNAARDFSSTSIDIVMKKMKHSQMCKIVKGFFPESLNNLPGGGVKIFNIAL
jgi:O-methyltransferase